MKLIILIFSISMLLSLSACYRGTDQTRLVVAQVDQVQLKTGEFADILAYRLKDLDALSAKNQNHLDRIKKDIVNDFIVQAITERWAKENQVGISDEEILEEIQKIRSNYPDDIAFRRHLAREQLSFERWKKNLQFTLLQKKIIGLLRQELPAISDQEVEDYYKNNKNQFQRNDQVMVQQVVVKSQEDAERIMKEVKRGSDLGELASKYSIAPEANDNGLTDWIDIQTLDIFEKAYKLPIGRLKMMKSPFGHHVLKVVKKRKKGTLSLKSMKERIEGRLQQDQEQAMYTSWLDQQIRRNRVFKNEKLISKIFVETKEK